MRACVVLMASVAVLYGGCRDADPTITRPIAPVWCPATVPTTQAFDARKLLGKSPEQARRDSERQGCDFRVVVEDGEERSVTADQRYDRVEAVVEDDVVVEISVG